VMSRADSSVAIPIADFCYPDMSMDETDR
jgi:hypothetical protein